MVIYAFLIAILLVAGQTLWKLAATDSSSLEKLSLLPFVTYTLLNPKFVLGAMFYVIATVGYVWLFSKFSYTSVQLTLISFSIIVSFLVATIFFKEHLNYVNIIGIIMILAGVFFVIWKR